MPEETKDETKEEGLSFKTAEDLTKFLTDLQGQIVNMQETIDKLSPVKEEVEEVAEGQAEEELSDEEISEIDMLLQSE